MYIYLYIYTYIFHIAPDFFLTHQKKCHIFLSTFDPYQLCQLSPSLLTLFCQNLTNKHIDGEKAPVKNSWMSYGQLNHHLKKGYTDILYIYIST